MYPVELSGYISNCGHPSISHKMTGTAYNPRYCSVDTKCLCRQRFMVAFGNLKVMSLESYSNKDYNHLKIVYVLFHVNIFVSLLYAK